MENNKAKSDDNSVSIEFIQDFITASTDVINLSYENFRKNFIHKCQLILPIMQPNMKV